MEVNEGVEEEKIYPTYLQKELYEIQIKDIENRIDRLDDRNYELEKSLEEIKKNIDETDIETEDAIAGINRELYAEKTKIDTSLEAIKLLDQQRNEDKQKHEMKVKELNEQYETTLRIIISKIKNLNSKVNALEDYKNKRDNLREMLKLRDEFLINREEEVERRLQKIKIQFKIDRAALLDDLQNQIFQRGIAYETENMKKTALLTRCLFQNNIFMKNEVDTIRNELCKGVEFCADKDRTKSFNTAWARNSHLEMMKALETLAFRRSLSKYLNEKYEKPKISDAGSLNSKYPDYDSIIEKLQFQVQNAEHNLAKTQTLSHQKNVKLFSAKHKNKHMIRKMNDIVNTLYDVKYAIACVLQLPVISDFQLEKSEPKFTTMSKEDFITYLISLINERIQL